MGSSVTLDGVNFSIAAPHATNVELLIFQNEDDEYAKEKISLDQKHRSGDYWHIEIEGLTEGTLYGYRISIDGLQATGENLVLDPCARAIAGWQNYIRNQGEKGNKDYNYFNDKKHKIKDEEMKSLAHYLNHLFVLLKQMDRNPWFFALDL